MKLQLVLNRVDKLFQVTKSPRLLIALFHHHVLAGAEHRFILSRELTTVIDIGANRGQFALAARQWASKARVISFEPLLGPAQIFRQVFSNDSQVTLHEVAIGNDSSEAIIHVSGRDDSSSLLPISMLQDKLFPGTAERSTAVIRVEPLHALVKRDEIKSPALLKIDVQGYEYETLMGCQSLLQAFEQIYCECSFVELYTGQKLASEVIAWLAEQEFSLVGVHNTTYDDAGLCVQADLLFSNINAKHL
jgi:FkbM family methyltransferase